MKVIFQRDVYNPAYYGQAFDGQVLDVPDDLARQLIERDHAREWTEPRVRSSVGLVSCIMPTKNRRRFVPRAIGCFMAQTYAAKELIVLDNGEPIADLLPRDERIRYTRLTVNQKTGQLRNYCCHMATGEFIAHWDDDDWSHPRRLEEQIAALGDKQVVGYRSIYFDGPSGEVWRYVGPRHSLTGTSLFYRRAYWLQNQFPGQNVGEDGAFVKRAIGKLVELDGLDRMVAATHESNTSPRSYTAEWSKVDKLVLPKEYAAI